MFMLLATFISAQGIFSPIQTESVVFGKKSIHPPEKFHAYSADDQVLSKAIDQALLNNQFLELPLADGATGLFMLEPYSIAQNGFYKNFPSITTFKLTQIDGQLKGYGDHTPHGFHAVLHGDKGLTYIDPTHRDKSMRAYAVYYTKDYKRSEEFPAFECQTDQLVVEEEEPGREISPSHRVDTRTSVADSVPLRTYRFVAATTAEYSNFHGGNVSSVASALATMMVRVNEIMQREYSIKFELIDSTQKLFFFDSDEDGFTNGNTSRLINEGASIIPTTIGPSQYDIGHVFCTNAGGLASVRSVCRSSKVRGVSCSFSPIGDSYYVDIVCHELGHQMGSRHSFNYCRGQNESLSKGYEPGSGVTIMAYAGLCGSRNTQNFTDPYYNIGSIVSIINYMHDGAGTTCAEITPRDNTPPVITLPYEDGFSIPLSTPFELHASATDETENLLYCWEQYDAASINCEPGDPEGTCPLFRSFPPTPDSFRIFPQLSDIVTGSFDRWEVLPDYPREMNFSCTVRDWEEDGGALAWEFVSFEVADAGPFVVDRVRGDYEVGEQIEINWEVANTDKAPVNCKSVDIYLSTDGGSSFPHLIAENVPNIGQVKLNLPNLPSNQAKVKVKASNNIFFNISRSTFSISSAATAGFIGAVSPYAQQVCLPTTANVEISTEPYLGFSDMISVFEVNGLPPTAQYEVSPQMVAPGESLTIDIDFRGTTENTYPLEVILAGGDDTVAVETRATVVSNDFSALVGTRPISNAENITQLPTFRWDTVPDADRYIVQVADYPTFDESSILYESNEIEIDSHLINGLLPKNSLLYWRVIPINECGLGSASPIRVFHTEAQACETIKSTDVPRNISTSGNSETTSEVTFNNSGIVSDVNVLNLRGRHGYIGELKAYLVSPELKEVRLFDTECFNLQDFHLTLDDEAPSGITCPLNSQQTMRPRGKLSDFNGQGIQGVWQIRLNDNTAGIGGELQGWSLELCGSISVAKPTLNSDTVYINEVGGQAYITSNQLNAQKDGIPDYQMTYTIVKPTGSGTLSFTGDGSPLQAGAQFNQDAVNNWWLAYQHDPNADTTDYMTFTISDQQDGWVGLDTLYFVVDSTSSTGNVPSIDFSVFPNPAADQFTVNVPDLGSDGEIDLLNMHGQVIQRKMLNGSLRYRFESSDLPKGMYFIKINSDQGRGTKRIVIQ
jgi:subtilisin-like proprotein convertase family protein